MSQQKDNQKDNQKQQEPWHIGMCYICHEECNPCSQTCGMCARMGTSALLQGYHLRPISPDDSAEDD